MKLCIDFFSRSSAVAVGFGILLRIIPGVKHKHIKKTTRYIYFNNTFNDRLGR